MNIINKCLTGVVLKSRKQTWVEVEVQKRKVVQVEVQQKRKVVQRNEVSVGVVLKSRIINLF
jgi:hypothetical protein